MELTKPYGLATYYFEGRYAYDKETNLSSIAMKRESFGIKTSGLS